MKNVRWLLPLAVLCLVLALSSAAMAAGTDPSGAVYVDSGSHSIAPNGSTWYRFEYPGNHSQITAILENAKDSGLAFEVFSPSQMQEWWSKNGIGAGSVKDNDLLWSGNSHEAGTWYVKVMNNGESTMPYRLLVTGSDVSLSPATSAPAAPPSVTQVTPGLENMDPNLAKVLDSETHSIPAATTLWYRFPYAGSNHQATLVIPNAKDEGLRVHVHTPQQMKTWWSATPVGQAMPHGSDLLWTGNAPESGWWYVEVMNDNAYAVPYQLLLSMPERAVRQ